MKTIVLGTAIALALALGSAHAAAPQDPPITLDTHVDIPFAYMHEDRFDVGKDTPLQVDLGKMKQGGTPARFSSDTRVIDRREQRKLDQAQGLVSFPVKIKQTLIASIRSRAAEQNLSTDQVIGELLEQALNGQPAHANLG